MKIAVPYEDGMIFQHFGHTKQMKIYHIENGQLAGEEVADTSGSGHGALAGFLSGLGADTLICGGIGQGAKDALAEAGIKLYGGVSGSADKAVRDFLDGKLACNPDVRCGTHGHDCHNNDGRCGEDKHGCVGNGGTCHS